MEGKECLFHSIIYPSKNCLYLLTDTHTHKKIIQISHRSGVIRHSVTFVVHSIPNKISTNCQTVCEH